MIILGNFATSKLTSLIDATGNSVALIFLACGLMSFHS
jgi:hypothetical protein